METKNVLVASHSGWILHFLRHLRTKGWLTFKNSEDKTDTRLPKNAAITEIEVTVQPESLELIKCHCTSFQDARHITNI